MEGTHKGGNEQARHQSLETWEGPAVKRVVQISRQIPAVVLLGVRGSGTPLAMTGPGLARVREGHLLLSLTVKGALGMYLNILSMYYFRYQ